MKQLQKLNKATKPIIDKVLGKTISKKLIVFTVACVALFSGKLTSGDWTFIACLYMFGLIFLNYADRYKKPKNLSEEQEDGLN